MKPSVAALVLTPILLAGAIASVWAPRWAPGLVLASLAAALVPVVEAWRAAAGTALRAAVVWAALAVALGIASQGVGWFEPLRSGRPLSGHLVYLSVLMTFAALISVLNARTPGGTAWAILMALLVLVFLIPWLEGPGMARKAQGLNRLRLDAPWSIFYVLVVLAGVTNYLPTRYGPAAACLGLGLACEYAALTRPGVRLAFGPNIWSFVPWTLSASVLAARRLAARKAGAANGLDATWRWFRDHWGVVWALRVQERFNRTAEMRAWPIRLGWYGAIGPGGATVEIPPGAEETLRSLLRRFADDGRIVTGAHAAQSCTCLPPQTGG